MKILLLGSNGFIGQNVAKALVGAHQILLAAKDASGDTIEVDLTSQESVEEIIKDFSPDVVVNCAGIVANSEQARLNVLFTKNVIEATRSANLKPKIIICGSASVYGVVNREDLPINEEHPKNPKDEYAKSKYEEEKLALSLSEQYDLKTIILRIFNPIGRGMKGRFLISHLIQEIEAVKKLNKTSIQLNRKDSLRDYLDVRDLAMAIRLLIEKPNNYNIYNVGSGVTTSNEKILSLLLDELNVQGVKIEETSDRPELLLACQADISRIVEDTGWKLNYKIEDTIKEIVHAQG